MELPFTNRQLQMLEKLNLPKIELTNVITMHEIPLVKRGYSNLIQTEVVVKSKINSGLDFNRIVNEAFVGLFGINTLFPKISNFMLTYSFEFNHNIKVGDKIKPYDSVYSQFIDGIDFNQFFLFSTLSDYKSVLLQIILALTLAYRQLKFNHNDLHAENIIVKTLDQSYNTIFNDQVVTKSIYQPVIIDFDISSIEIDGYYYNIPEQEEGNKTSVQQDIVTLLDSIQEPLNYLVFERNAKFYTEGMNKSNFSAADLDRRLKNLNNTIIDMKKMTTVEQQQKFEIHRLLYGVADEISSVDQFFLDSLQILKTN